MRELSILCVLALLVTCPFVPRCALPALRLAFTAFKQYYMFSQGEDKRFAKAMRSLPVALECDTHVHQHVSHE